MDGYILLSDGTKLEGELAGPATTAFGWVVANTAVVGFQEMTTDPAYRGRILAFTYPEIGNVGMTGDTSESGRFQVAGLVVKVLSTCRSHYLSQEEFRDALEREKVPCLTNVDTRALAVHLRDAGEMAAAIAPAQADAKGVAAKLAAMTQPAFAPPDESPVAAGGSGAKVAVINLGVRCSMLRQLNSCCNPVLVPCGADARGVLAGKPVGVIISDGPDGVPPPKETVKTVKALLGKVPLLGCGLGHTVLGEALGCKSSFLKRGHHGVNYPVRNLVDGSLEVTVQRHSVLLDRDSVEKNPDVEVLWENLNDHTVEGIRSADGSAFGLQIVPASPTPGVVNAHLQKFVNSR